MVNSREQLILFSAQQDNILPLTSACNVRCVFCSHPQNPSGVQVYGIGHRSMEDVAQTLEFMNPEKKIVIGESVTRIMEGEPFLHPEIKQILRMIRQKFAETLIQITTNGTLLDEAMLLFIKELGGIELTISLNSATPEGRKLLMGDDSVGVCNAIKFLSQLDIPFQGSIVAMPWVVGWKDIVQTVMFLDNHQAETIRIFMPGFTAKAPEYLRFAPELVEELIQQVKSLQKQIETPLVLEPAFVKDLSVRVEGVVEGSPAAQSGFLFEDEILQINDNRPFSRVDAFYQLVDGGDQRVRLLRQGGEEVLVLHKADGVRPGLVMSYDIAPEVYYALIRGIQRWQARCPLLMVSRLAEPVMRLLVKMLQSEMPEIQLELVVVDNRFFGGSIMSAGLWVIQDLLDTWASLPNHEYDLILLPGIFLDPWGHDLTGRPLSDLEDEVGINLQIIDT